MAHVWNFLWLGCQQFGFWCRCTWFGFFGSKLIRSNNESRATLWVLETCLIVGLLHFIIILITASLSSNTYNKASWRANWTYEGTESMSFITSIRLWDWCFLTSPSGCPDRSGTWETLPKTATIRSHSSRASKQSNLSPVSKEMISDSVELCETEVCFLHIQLVGTNVRLSKTHNVPHDVILNPQDLPRMYLTILQQILFPLLWSGGHQCRE